MGDRLHINRMYSWSCDLFKFWEINDNISETVRVKNAVAMEDS